MPHDVAFIMDHLDLTLLPSSSSPTVITSFFRLPKPTSAILSLNYPHQANAHGHIASRIYLLASATQVKVFNMAKTRAIVVN